MKKVLCIAVVALMAVSIGYADETSDEPGNIGIGYQGVLFEGYTMNQISLRYAPEPIGGALVFGHMKRDHKDGGSDWEDWLLQAKGFYTLIDRQNSDFYVGGTLGWGYSEYKSGGSEEEDTTWLIGALAGVEWNFTELPEVGFNFEFGYNVEFIEEDDGSSEDSIFKGTYVSLGAHYYF